VNGFEQAVEGVKGHDDGIISIAAGDDGVVSVVYDLIENRFESIAGFAKSDDSHPCLPLVLFVVQV
jgi:hypothetical protein